VDALGLLVHASQQKEIDPKEQSSMQIESTKFCKKEKNSKILRRNVQQLQK